MPASQLDQVGERPLNQLGQTVSEQALVLVRQQVEVARRELTTKARQAAPGAAMVGGAALLTALASGTGTAALVLLLARRPGPSAAALGVTGAYAGAGALLAREGLVRLRQAGPFAPEDKAQDAEPPAPAKPDAKSAPEKAQNAKQTPASAKRGARSAPKRAARATPRSKGSANAQPDGSRKQSRPTRRRTSSRTT